MLVFHLTSDLSCIPVICLPILNSLYGCIVVDSGEYPRVATCHIWHNCWNSRERMVEDEENQESRCRKQVRWSLFSWWERVLPNDCCMFIHTLGRLFQLKPLCLTTCLLGSPWVPHTLRTGAAHLHGSSQMLCVLGVGLALALLSISSFSHSSQLLMLFACHQLWWTLLFPFTFKIYLVQSH